MRSLLDRVSHRATGTKLQSITRGIISGHQASEALAGSFSSSCVELLCVCQQDVMRAAFSGLHIFAKQYCDAHLRCNHALRHYSSAPLTTQSSETTVNIKVGLKATIPLRQATLHELPFHMSKVWIAYTTPSDRLPTLQQSSTSPVGPSSIPPIPPSPL